MEGKAGLITKVTTSIGKVSDLLRSQSRVRWTGLGARQEGLSQDRKHLDSHFTPDAARAT
jgi:hypothetical protein